MSSLQLTDPEVARRHAANLAAVRDGRRALAEDYPTRDPLEWAVELHDALLPLHTLSELGAALEPMVDLFEFSDYGITAAEVQQARDLLAYMHRLVDVLAAGLSGFRVESERLALQRDLRGVLSTLVGAESLATAIGAADIWSFTQRDGRQA